jgi:hypothetical protein
MRIKIGYETVGDCGRIPANEKDLIELYRRLGGRAIIGRLIRLQELPADLRPLWPEVEVERYDCNGPSWSHYKYTIRLPVDGVRFGEVGQAREACPFCGADICSHRRWEEGEKGVYFTNLLPKVYLSDSYALVIDEIVIGEE